MTATKRKHTPTVPSPTGISADSSTSSRPAACCCWPKAKAATLYVARRGWQVTAIDFSDEGRAKATRLASSQGVHPDYQVTDLTALSWEQPGQFEAIGLIFAHFAPATRRAVHAAAAASLAPGGHLLLEAFSPRQLGLASGGPREAELLYEPAALAQDFAALHLLENREVNVVLHEGAYHTGPAAVVLLLATRPHLSSL